MTTELIAPTLQELGEAMFGPAWREVLAYEFDVTEEVIAGWEINSSRRPMDIEDRIHLLAVAQIELIETRLAQLEVTGLRKPEN